MVKNIEFEIPEEIMKGLINGFYKRTGGIIRNAKSGQIVGHLKEASGMGIESNGKILEQLGSLQNGIAFMGALQIVNLGVSIAGFAMLNNKLKNIGKDIKEISHNLNQVIDHSKANQAIQLSTIYASVVNFRQQSADYAIARDKQSRKQALYNAYNDLCISQKQMDCFFKDKRILKTLLGEDSNDLTVLFDLYTMAGNGIVNFNIAMGEREIALLSIERIKQSIIEVIGIFVALLKSKAIGNDFLQMEIFPQLNKLTDKAVEVDRIFESKIIYLKENTIREVVDLGQPTKLVFEYAQAS